MKTEVFAAGVKRWTQNTERRIHHLLAVSFTCVCLRLAFICWKRQQFMYLALSNKYKLTTSKHKCETNHKQTVHSAIGVLPLPKFLLLWEILAELLNSLLKSILFFQNAD